MLNEEDYIPITEAVALTKKGRPYFYNLISANKIRFIKNDGRILFHREDVLVIAERWKNKSIHEKEREIPEKLKYLNEIIALKDKEIAIKNKEIEYLKSVIELQKRYIKPPFNISIASQNTASQTPVMMLEHIKTEPFS